MRDPRRLRQPAARAAAGSGRQESRREERPDRVAQPRHGAGGRAATLGRPPGRARPAHARLQRG